MPLRRRRDPDIVPEPPVRMPPGGIVHVPGRGEFFVRDTGPSDGEPLLLLHGWMFSADLNWWPVYGALRDAGYRVIALDHRGHGRGLRTPEDFRLADCAADAAGVLDELGVGPVTAVGYSMGGPVAQLLARDHPDHVRALVLCATATDWQDPYLKVFWRTMAVLRLGMGLFPTAWWNWLLAVSGSPRTPERAWTAAELSRGNSTDLAEAGRELSRHDARPWIRTLRGKPAAVVMTTRDTSVLPRKQQALARALDAHVVKVRGDHVAVASAPDAFREALFAALRATGAHGAVQRAAAA